MKAKKIGQVGKGVPEWEASLSQFWSRGREPGRTRGVKFQSKASGQCKGPEARESLVCSRKDTSVAELSETGRE